MSSEVVKRICNVYGVNEKWLLEGKCTMTEKVPVDKESIGVRLKAVRKDKKLTQTQFASVIG